jgi:BirA family biotin operon repressor/biotin-[acetyl-CoA-carboxylase] ligase
MNLDLTHLKAATYGYAFGREIRSFREISSTQDYAVSIAETDPYCHGLVIVSESQSSGHGRRGREWLSPQGGLWFSVITKSDIKSRSAIFLSYAMSLAVCETMANKFNIEVSIKWPNDVLIKARKVAGVLLSSAIRGEGLEYCVIGVGINLNSRPRDLKGSTSLIEHIGQSSVAVEPFLASILVLFSNYYDEIESGNEELITKRWKLRCPVIGKMVRAKVDGVRLDGIASDIDSDGLLTLVTKSGQKVKISDTQESSIKIGS